MYRYIKRRLSVPMSALWFTIVCLLGACDSNSNSTPATPQTPEPPSTEVPPPPSAAPPAPPEEGRLNVTAAFPSVNDERIALVTRVTVLFDADLLTGQNLQNLIRLSYDQEPVAGSVRRLADNRLEFQPTNLLQPSRTYDVYLSEDLMSAEGLTLANAAQHWQFTTIGDVYTTSQEVIDLCMSGLDVEMLGAVNAARQSARDCGDQYYPATHRLQWSCHLQESSIRHTQDMTEHDFFAHAGSDGSNVGERVNRTGYSWRFVGENLAAGQRTVGEAMTGLLDSPGHCQNIMSPNYREFGSAYLYESETYYKRYWTQNFATPR